MYDFVTARQDQNSHDVVKELLNLKNITSMSSSKEMTSSPTEIHVSCRDQFQGDDEESLY